jgi:predicted small integral membrane protein
MKYQMEWLKGYADLAKFHALTAIFMFLGGLIAQLQALTLPLIFGVALFNRKKALALIALLQKTQGRYMRYAPKP